MLIFPCKRKPQVKRANTDGRSIRSIKDARRPSFSRIPSFALLTTRTSLLPGPLFVKDAIGVLLFCCYVRRSWGDAKRTHYFITFYYWMLVRNWHKVLKGPRRRGSIFSPLRVIGKFYYGRGGWCRCILTLSIIFWKRAHGMLC